jgi:ribonuclease-3
MCGPLTKTATGARVALGDFRRRPDDGEENVNVSAVAQCQEIIEYTFRDPSLLAQALTHASVSPTRLESNERLEFLGDAVLGLCICAALYRQQEDLLEGEMTKVKSSVVSRKTCAVVTQKLGLSVLLNLGGDMADPSNIPESVAAAVLESIIGAIYLDGGFEPADAFILRHMQPLLDAALENAHHENYKSVLQQYAQRNWSTTPDYVLMDEQGPDHSKCFEVAVSIDGRNFPSAWGRSKKEAEQAAAQRALIELGFLMKGDSEQSPEERPMTE